MNSRLKKKKASEVEYEVEKILNKRLTDDNKLQYLLKWKGFPKSESTWEPVENLNCPILLADYEESLKRKYLSRKKTLRNRKNDSRGSAQKKKEIGKCLGEPIENFKCRKSVNDCKESLKIEYSSRKRKLNNLNKDCSGSARKRKAGAFNINSLPNEIITKIFAHLPQNHLGLISRVCKRWNLCIKNPVLWRKVDVNLQWEDGSFNEIVACFLEKLPAGATHLLLDFTSDFDWFDSLHFEEFCINVREKCPCLQSLVLFSAEISVPLLCAIDISTHSLPNLEVLSFEDCDFGDDLPEKKYQGISKVKVLDLNSSYDQTEDSEKRLNSKMPYLKKLYLGDTSFVSDFLLRDTSLLQQLEVLQLGITADMYEMYQEFHYHALNITELFLCWTRINDYVICSNNAGFPHLKTICVRHTDVTSEGIIFLIQSFPSLQNIYVTKGVAKTYERHPFNAKNKCHFHIVKAVDVCDEHLDLSCNL